MLKREGVRLSVEDQSLGPGRRKNKDWCWPLAFLTKITNGNCVGSS